MLTIAAFDLETSNLSGDYGVLGVAVVQPSTARAPVVYRADEICKDWAKGRSNDREIVRRVAESLASFDILIAHNGATGRGFDVPFLQSRLARWGLPAFPRKKMIDPVQIARNQFRLSSNSLESISAHLGLEPKMKLPPSVWLEAFLDGDKRAMDRIVARCKSDVKILCDIVKVVKSYCQQLDHRGSSW